MGAGQLEARHWELARRAAGAHDDVRGSQSRSVVALDHVRLDEAGGSGVLVEGHAGLLELVAQERVRAHLAGYLAHAGEQTPIVERGLAGADPVTPELPCLPHQARRVGQGSHRHRPVVGGHSPELVARDERGSSSESRRAQRSDDARGPGADHDHIEVVRGHARSVACPGPPRAWASEAPGRGACGMGDTPVEVALSVRAQHAEGPLWDAATARLWWVDITAERVHCFDPESSEDSSWSTGRAAGWRGARSDGRPGGGKPGGPGGARPRHGQAGSARSDRAGQAREPRQRHQGRQPGKGLGRHDGLRQAAAERGARTGSTATG